jgi:hypothetical protein
MLRQVIPLSSFESASRCCARAVARGSDANKEIAIKHAMASLRRGLLFLIEKAPSVLFKKSE